MPVTAFISYSWDDDAHKVWARSLAERLRRDGIDTTLDQWAIVPGDQLPQFMEQAIGANHFVLIVCTPRYKIRSEFREGGVGYEGDIITAEILQSRNHRKFIPVLRRGDWHTAAPNWLAGKYFVDLREGPGFEANYQDLLSTLHGSRSNPPPVGQATRSRMRVQGSSDCRESLNVPDRGLADLNARFESLLDSLSDSHLIILKQLNGEFWDRDDVSKTDSRLAILQKRMVWQALHEGWFAQIAGIPQPEVFVHDLKELGLIERQYEGSGMPLTGLGRRLLKYCAED